MHECASSPVHGQHRRDVGQPRPSPAPTTARHALPAFHQVSHTAATAHSGLTTSLPRVSRERAKPPQHRDSLAGATLPLSVMETLVPVPCPQLPPALPCRQSGWAARPGQALASQPRGRRPAGMEKVLRKQEPTPTAPGSASPPAVVPGSIALPRAATASSSPATTCKRGRIFQGPPSAGVPPCGTRQGRVSGSGRADPSSPEAPGRSSARSTGHREGGWAWTGGRARGSLGRDGRGHGEWETPRLSAGNSTSPAWSGR